MEEPYYAYSTKVFGYLMLTFLSVLSVFASVEARDHRHNKKGYLSHGKSSEETVDDVQMWTYIGIEKVVDFQGPRYGFWCGVESSVGVEVKHFNCSSRFAK